MQDGGGKGKYRKRGNRGKKLKIGRMEIFGGGDRMPGRGREAMNLKVK